MKTIKEIFRSYAELNADGIHIGGSDRESNHRYGDAYESIFPDRRTVQSLLEIGVADGSSLLAWREVFPNAIITGMDIHPPARICLDTERIFFLQGDQRSYADCQLVGRYGFDVIIEDATHVLANTLLTLLYLWPAVKPGGVYIVEEWDGIGSLRDNVLSLFPNAMIVNTNGPFGGIESLVVFRKGQ